MPVDATGFFRQPITLTEGKATTLKLVATDVVGNRTEQTATITYSATVPAVTLKERITLSGKVAQGTSLTYQGQKVLVGLDGSFKLDVQLSVGANSFVLSASSGGKSTGFIQFDVLLPVRVDAPAALSSGQVTLSGKTLPGYLVAVNDQLATVQADGSFSITFDKKGAIAVVTVMGDGQTHKLEVPMP